jgi:two-component system phosphate regulon sensor histidine kinase PhoR
MPRIGFRTKFFFIAITLVLGGHALGALYIEHQLRSWISVRMEQDLLGHARVAADLLRVGATRDTIDEIHPLAKRLARATHTRVTVMDVKGRVLGDSQLDTTAKVAMAANHADRVEVKEALSKGRGTARRYSETAKVDLLYVAIPYSRRGIVRISTPLSEEQRIVSWIRFLLLVTGLVALVAVILLSFVGNRLLSHTLRELVDSSRAIIEGRRKRIVVLSKDELGSLAGSFNLMAEELERMVSSLANERATLQAIMEGMSESVLAIDDERRITLANPASMKLLGLKTPPTGELFEETFELPELHELVADATHEALTSEFRVFQPEKRWIMATAAPLRGEGGGQVVVLHDMTEVRKLEGMRRNFVANVSHELRTPVSHHSRERRDAARRRARRPQEPRGDFLLAAVLRHTERLSRIISDLLDISRVEAGRYPLELEPIPVLDIAERAAVLMKDAAESKSVKIELDVDEQCWVRADGNALEQVLFNLLENAIKYTPDGSKVVIRTSCSENGEKNGSGMHEVQVVDDGDGIPEKHRTRLFERFYRVDRGRSRDKGGTGLGLAIVKHLSEAMDGRAGMRGAEPNGSIFWVTLPAAEPIDESEDLD